MSSHGHPATPHYTVFTEPKSYADARDACRAVGGFLAGIYSYENNRHLHGQLFLAPAEVGQTVWIGGSDSDVEGVYRWDAGGTTFPPSPGAEVNYENWGPGEPNDGSAWGTINSEDCVEMYIESGQWNDRVCDFEQAYVCEGIPPPAMPPAPPSPPAPPRPPPPPPSPPSHYGDPFAGCAADEITVGIQGMSGEVCAPKCAADLSCPTDVPLGVTALPQCALQDGAGNKYCVLECTPGMICGVKASCKSSTWAEICTYDS